MGCGNGWVVRKIASEPLCKKALGIDKSKKMISQAQKNKRSSKESYIHTGIEEWKFKGKFDYVFSIVITSYSIHYTKLYEKPQ